MGARAGELGLIPRRQELLQIDNSARAVPGTGSALYSSILAGFQQLSASYQPDHNNVLLVLTGGAETAPGDISLSTLLTGLRNTYNPQRPIEIIIVKFGPGGNLAQLRQIASAAQ